MISQLPSLPSHLAQHADDASELSYIDFKRECLLSKSKACKDLAKDICAMANLGNYQSYIIIGISDREDRLTGFPDVPGLTIPSDEIKSMQVYEQQITEAINSYCNPHPLFDIKFYQYKEKIVSTICVTPTPVLRPYVLSYDLTKVWVRRGSHNKEATIDEILDMGRDSLRYSIYAEFFLELTNLINEVRVNVDKEKVSLILLPFLQRNIRNFIKKSNNKHELFFILARFHFLASDYLSCIESIDNALKISYDLDYLFLKAEAIYSRAFNLFRDYNLENESGDTLIDIHTITYEAKLILDSINRDRDSVYGYNDLYLSTTKLIQDINLQISIQKQQQLLDSSIELFNQSNRYFNEYQVLSNSFASLKTAQEKILEAKQSLDMALQISKNIADSPWIEKIDKLRVEIEEEVKNHGESE